MELFSIRIQRTFQLVSTLITHNLDISKDLPLLYLEKCYSSKLV